MFRFSRRTPAEYRPNELTRAREACAHPVRDATVSNPTQAGMFDDEDTSWLRELAGAQAARYQPEPRGLLEAREAVSGYYAGHGVEIPASRIFLTSSSSESYAWLAKLLCDAGDEILTPQPSYPLFDCLLELEAVRARPYPLVREDHWRIDFDALDKRRTERTRALIYVHPNNPTGSYLKRDEAARLLEFCARHDLALLSDEVFYDFAFAPDARRMPPLAGSAGPAVFSLGGLSKLAGLPQMKLGWVAVNAPGALLPELLERLEWIADSYLPVSAPVQYAAPAWLRGVAVERRQAIVRRTRASLELVRGALKPPFRMLEPEGGWSALIEVPRIRTDEEWAVTLLREYGVVVQPGYFYDFERDGYLVVSLLAPAEVLSAAVQALTLLAER